MFAAKVETVFFAGHQITFADGTVEDLHEHEWVVRAAVKSPKLDEHGFVIDFVWLKAELEKVTKSLVGSRLEDHHYFVESNINASAENIAKYMLNSLGRATFQT